MLSARRRGSLRAHYVISEGRRRLTTWTPPHKGAGGEFVVDGVSYLVDAVPGSSHAVLQIVDGPPVAVAEGLGRTPWTVRTHDGAHTFDRTLDRWTEQQLFVDGRPVGGVRQAGRSGRLVEVDLPGVADPVAVFVLALVLDMWASADQARAGRR
jgi:hypothetical protein